MTLIHPNNKYCGPRLNGWAVGVQKSVGVGVLVCWILKKQESPADLTKASWHWPDFFFKEYSIDMKSKVGPPYILPDFINQ